MKTPPRFDSESSLLHSAYEESQEEARLSYSGMPEQLKASALALSERVRSQANATMARIAAARRHSAGLPAENDTEVVALDAMPGWRISEYFFHLGLESGVKLLAAQLYDFMVGGKFRAFQDEGAPQRPMIRSENNHKFHSHEHLLRPAGAKKPPFTPRLADSAAYFAAGAYIGISPEGLNAAAIRKDDAGGVEQLPHPPAPKDPGRPTLILLGAVDA